VDDAALPRRLGEELRSALRQPHTSIGDDQPDTAQAAFLEMFEEAAPACFVLFGTFADAENLPISTIIDPDRHQQRDVADLAGPAALEYNAVQVNVRVLAFDRSVAPSLDRSVNLLVRK
jgi:hypothetical protein